MSSARSWDRLYAVAEGQAGYFSGAQARRAGYSPQRLARYLANGRVIRPQRGVYRLRHFPSSEYGPVIAAWLWSGRAAVVSHESALALHGISMAAPARVHLTVPLSWRRRRLKVPAPIILHHADVPERDRTCVGAIPVTSLARTLLDCPPAMMSPPKAAGTLYLFLICAETLLEGMSRTRAAQHLAAYRRLTDKLRRRGQLVAGGRLLTADSAATVRVRRGRVKVTDGPFAETKELVGGFLVIRARSRAEAVRIASSVPGAHIGCVEVRPLADDPATLAALGLPIG
jgi:hypothetical protein